MKIYIIRHGETAPNLEGRIQGGGINAPLNEAGIRLAVLTGKALQGVRFDAVFSSPLQRAVQTAELLLTHSGNSCPIVTDERLREIMAGDFEGFIYRPAASDPATALCKRYFDDPFAFGAFPGGESVEDVIARTQSFLLELAQKSYETVLVSTHGCALRCMLNFLYDNPKDFWHGRVPYNCAVNIVEAGNGKFRLLEDDKIFYDKALCADRYGTPNQA